jgi:hypothetical protein
MNKPVNGLVTEQLSLLIPETEESKDFSKDENLLAPLKEAKPLKKK